MRCWDHCHRRGQWHLQVTLISRFSSNRPCYTPYKVKASASPAAETAIQLMQQTFYWHENCLTFLSTYQCCTARLQITTVSIALFKYSESNIGQSRSLRYCNYRLDVGDFVYYSLRLSDDENRRKQIITIFRVMKMQLGLCESIFYGSCTRVLYWYRKWLLTTGWPKSNRHLVLHSSCNTTGVWNASKYAINASKILIRPCCNL